MPPARRTPGSLLVLAAGPAQHEDKLVMAGLYLRAGPGEGRWLTHDELRRVLGLCVELLNDGRIAGLRIFGAHQFVQRPEYLGWAKELLSGVTCR